jgi:hypothetical protein
VPKKNPSATHTTNFCGKKCAKKTQIWREIFLKSPYLLRQWVAAAHQYIATFLYLSAFLSDVDQIPIIPLVDDKL